MLYFCSNNVSFSSNKQQTNNTFYNEIYNKNPFSLSYNMYIVAFDVVRRHCSDSVMLWRFINCRVRVLLLPSGSAAGSSAGIVFTHGPILRFFAPQGRRVAPIKVKFGREERSAPPCQICP